MTTHVVTTTRGPHARAIERHAPPGPNVVQALEACLQLAPVRLRHTTHPCATASEEEG